MTECGGCHKPMQTTRPWSKFCSDACREKVRRVRRGHTPRPAFTVSDRFWAHVAKGEPEACWEWTGARTRGYGVFGTTGSDTVRAHRYSWTLAHGPIPEGLVVRHRCDNPPCVNPAHLELGTQAENLRDMVERGRHHSQRTAVTA